MTLAIDSTVATALSTAGTSNNPIIAYGQPAGTWSTTVGTQVEAASNLATYSTYDPWVCTGSQAVAQLVLSSSQSFNFALIAAHNFADSGGTVRVQYSTNSGSTWVTTGAGQVSAMADNSAIGFYFNDQAADYWRIQAFGMPVSTNTSVGAFILSNVITVEQRIYQGYRPPITPTAVDLQNNMSDGGHYMGSAVIRRGSTANAAFSHIDPATLRGSTWKAFQNHFNDGDPFAFAWRPTKYEDVFYAWRNGDPIAPENAGPQDYMSFNMGMRFYDDP